MLRVLRGLPVFNGRYQLQAWVARIAKNVSVDQLRSRSRRPSVVAGLEEVDGGAVAATDEDLEELVERIVRQEEVRAVLGVLPSHHREALVLREIEGRSHAEIADSMGMTSAQAKALIHRAKGSFRRAWIADGRHGIAALAPWFLLPALARKLAGGAHALATRAGATVTVVPEASVSATERVTAAAVAIAVAGSVGMGAYAIRHDADRPKVARPAAQVASAAPEIAAPILVPVIPDRRTDVPSHADRTRPDGPRGRPAEGPGDTEEAPPVAESPDPSQSPDPAPTPGSEPPVVIPPAPAWDLGFDVGVPGTAMCSECPASPSLISSTVTGTAGGTVAVTQVAQGTASDLLGRPSWAVNLQYWGGATGSSGQLGFEFRLGTEVGWFTYSGGAGLVSAAATDDGGYLYTFSGNYHLDAAPGNAAVPRQGLVEIQLRFWADGTTLYASSFALTEA